MRDEPAVARGGIYVETTIRAPMEALWRATQRPEAHQRWDLRFSTIDYLPRASEEAPQRFLYATRIGFGLRITGEGESTGSRQGAQGERISALRFWSAMPISLIERGAGYWKYIPLGEGIRFLTWYDYECRFGAAGRLLDRLFRPLIGWATAWSFDALRLWLEEGVPPEESARRWRARAGLAAAALALWGLALRRSRLPLPGVAAALTILALARDDRAPSAGRTQWWANPS